MSFGKTVMTLHAYAEAARAGKLKLVDRMVKDKKDNVMKKKWYWNMEGVRGAVTVSFSTPLEAPEHRAVLILPPSRFVPAAGAASAPPGSTVGALIGLRHPESIADCKFLNEFWVTQAFEKKVLKNVTSLDVMRSVFTTPFKEPSIDSEKTQNEYTVSVKLNVGPPEGSGVEWKGKPTAFSYVEARETVEEDGTVVKVLVDGDAFDWKTGLAGNFIPVYPEVEISELTNISNKNLYTTLYASLVQIDAPGTVAETGDCVIDNGTDKIRRVTKASLAAATSGAEAVGGKHASIAAGGTMGAGGALSNGNDAAVAYATFSPTSEALPQQAGSGTIAGVSQAALVRPTAAALAAAVASPVDESNGVDGSGASAAPAASNDDFEKALQAYDTLVQKFPTTKTKPRAPKAQ